MPSSYFPRIKYPVWMDVTTSQIGIRGINEIFRDKFNPEIIKYYESLRHISRSIEEYYGGKFNFCSAGASWALFQSGVYPARETGTSVIWPYWGDRVDVVNEGFPYGAIILSRGASISDAAGHINFVWSHNQGDDYIVALGYNQGYTRSVDFWKEPISRIATVRWPTEDLLFDKQVYKTTTKLTTGIKSGTSVIASGSTTIVVDHELINKPKDIYVTPTNSLGNATKFWIHTITSTQFTIEVDADPTAPTATFAWRAIL